MHPKDPIQRHQSIYRKLLRLYPKPYHEQFAGSMEQTFRDLLEERIKSNKRLTGFVLWICCETLLGILKENVSHMYLQKQRVIRLSIIVGFLLLIPLVAMRFTKEVAWTPFDFLIAGALLFGSGLLYEWISSRIKLNTYRYAVGIAVAAGLALIWVNLAVGIIGNEENPANLVFAGILLIGLIGAILSGFSPAGMFRTLLTMAIAQIIVSAITILGGWSSFFVNGFFAALWAVSALLFRRSAIQVQDEQQSSILESN